MEILEHAPVIPPSLSTRGAHRTSSWSVSNNRFRLAYFPARQPVAASLYSNPDRHVESAVAAYDLTRFHLRGSSGMKPKTAKRRWWRADLYVEIPKRGGSLTFMILVAV